MKLSIIIPTLNEEKYIGKLLDCLCKQSFKDFEVIVVDGKSVDKTREIIDTYKDKLVIAFIHSKKRSVAFQRNLGANQAKNDLLLFLDADVTLPKDFLLRSMTSWKKRTLAIPRYVPDTRNCSLKLFFFGVNILFF